MNLGVPPRQYAAIQAVRRRRLSPANCVGRWWWWSSSCNLTHVSSRVLQHFVDDEEQHAGPRPDENGDVPPGRAMQARNTQHGVVLGIRQHGNNRQAGTQARRHAGTQARRHAGTQARRQAGRQAGRHAGRQAGRHAHARTRGGRTATGGRCRAGARAPASLRRATAARVSPA